MGEWQSIETVERENDFDAPVLVGWTGRVDYEIATPRGLRLYLARLPTHWMRLPNPPASSAYRQGDA